MSQVPSELAIVPINDAVVFPMMMVPLVLNDPNLLRLADETLADHKIIGAFTQRETEVERPGPEDIYEVGTAVHIQKMIRFPNGEMRLMGQGLARIRLEEVTQVTPYLKGRVKVLEEVEESTDMLKAYINAAINTFSKIIDGSESLPDELKIVISSMKEGGRIADLIATNLNIDSARKQKLLEKTDVLERMKLLSKYLQDELEVLQLGKKLQSDVKKEMDREQREYYLRQQLKAIKRELGDEDDRMLELEELRTKIEQARLSPKAREAADKELDRLQKMSPGAAEYTVSKTYLDWILELPWEEGTTDNLDVKLAEKVLNEDHYDLEEVKERILEFLSVKKLKQSMKGSILCFVGPPGVGKTSLGQSIARAMERKFVRMSLGGMKDEAEIRGHRRTYIGALPGKIIQGMRNAGSCNPVFMLDEIDKLGSDFRGDPASALLEVLDPAQNHTFEDHYLNIPFDLSKTFFITTANLLDPIPRPLLDRMEVLELPGYITLEKMEIAKRYLVPRQLEENGIPDGVLSFTDEGLRHMILYYTREAGVRNIERKLASICRKVARRIASGNRRRLKITERNARRYLGVEEYSRETALKRPAVGVATGMAKTLAGGEILFIEALKMKGSGVLKLTGQLGGVMKESAEAAMSFIKANYLKDAEDSSFFDHYDIHVHVPAGAVPKDGPSAGVAIATTIASLMFGQPIRNDYAMTGEITLTGKVLPVGGIKDKVIAAHRAGIKTIILPLENKRDLDEIPETIKEDLEFIIINAADEAIERTIIWK
ncbi:MAG: endopeptidase La [Candidatus Latescibacteria bacterium]|nr:endopeptidase La [Candidatus Latescibacterota bacterium]NIM20912.1 endopeptidase La [Candidatus Latescibacterota bacterium]NIM65047.1 endopeptidase La [Candidatus Latescibacterota bacterium]NIO01562.1 endopeptidase La [Candidatus Latescibacterota bacterium]NIO28079.1 endopeptidase La [Candidatus Latescibacterota bacterium]